MTVANWKERGPSHLCLSPGLGVQGRRDAAQVASSSPATGWPEGVMKEGERAALKPSGPEVPEYLTGQQSPRYSHPPPPHAVLIPTTSIAKNAWAYTPHINYDISNILLTNKVNILKDEI